MSASTYLVFGRSQNFVFYSFCCTTSLYVITSCVQITQENKRQKCHYVIRQRKAKLDLFKLIIHLIRRRMQGVGKNKLIGINNKYVGFRRKQYVGKVRLCRSTSLQTSESHSYRDKV